MQISLFNVKNTINIDVLKQELTIFSTKMKAAFKVHSIYFVLLAVYFLSLVILDSVIDTPFQISTFLNDLVFAAPMTFFVVFIWIFMIRTAHMFIYSRPEHPIMFLVKDISNFVQKNSFNIIPVTVILCIFLPIFSTFKASIPLVNPFSWDLSLMELDRSLHFGIDPWRILQPIFGYWWVTFLLDVIYSLWFVVLWCVFIWMAASNEHTQLRMQYLLSFLLVWSLGGSLMATAFSSAGPAFYGHLDLGMNPYTPLMDYLNKVNEFIPIWVVKAQELLWMNYSNDNAVAAASISAMPSLHNTTSILMALLGWSYSRKAGIAGTIFASLIFVGSILLGWHYAVDGYVGFLVAVSCWWIAGRITKLYFKLPFVQKNMAVIKQA